MMETDSSSEEHSSSECSTDSSSDDDKLEMVQAHGSPVQVPQGLCEKREIFEEFFSVQTWNNLSEAHRQHLRRFLPKFPENDEQEKNVTLQRLFNGDIFKFSSPLDNFYEHLKAGHYRPDIAKMRNLIRRAERRESVWRHRKHKERLEVEILESRRKLLGQVSTLPPGVEPRLLKSPPTADTDGLSHRTKRRYFQILSSIRSRVDETGFSSDDNYPDGPPPPLSRKHKRHLNTLKNTSVLNGERIVVPTTALKPAGFDLERNISPVHNPFILTDASYRSLLAEHRKRKMEFGDEQELETKGRSLTDIIQRTRLNYNKKLNKPETPGKVVRKKIKKELSANECSSDSDSDSTVSSSVPVKVKARRVVKSASPKIQPQIPTPPVTAPPVAPVPKVEVKVEENVVQEQIKPGYKIPTPTPLTDFDTIDVMNIPIDLDDSNIDILDINNKAELMQDTHANFLALIRDIICSTSEHRMDMNALEERLRTWQENPISALNDWYSLADNWTQQLPSAINFLSGNFPEQPDDFVPYLEYKPTLNVYQWIGAGRDSDNSLGPLFKYWLERKNEMKPVITIKEKEDIDLDVMDRSQTPPPPRCPTNWTVRKADAEEIKSYREQERRRYDNPHKAFTYRCNGYESVVGPLKGVYNPSAGNAKARGHTMLSADRPNFVTILSLVRDATARLPNGEGTRAEICELLKCSQYISSTAAENVLQSVVSGALDRMHTQFDPCVKYDPKRKIWIYLHRNRTEEDFERLHQQYQGMNRNAKKPTKQKTPTKPKQPKVEKVVKNNAKPVEPVEKKVVETKQTSLLLPQKNASPKPQEEEKKPKPVLRQVSQEEKEINEALQSIVQNNTPTKTPVKAGKSLVKIITSNHGKSLIIPSSVNTVIKQDNRVITTKTQPQTPVVSQQLFQTLTQQQKQQQISGTQQLIRLEMPEKDSTQKKNVSIQQQILQSISPQQLQNIKNVTLLRNVRHSGSPIVISQNEESNQSTATLLSSDGTKTEKIETSQPIRVQHSTLTLSQQQQIIQSIRQKGVQQGINSQQQVLIRHKNPIVQKNATAAGTSLLGQTRVVSDVSTTKPIMTTGQSPLVAKVLTNAAGQVISVESLLAHQKQHGALPQGTTLRVSGVKGGANIIQLAASGNKTTMAQVAVSQNNFITLSNQPKLVLSSTPVTTTVTTSMVTPAKTVTKTVTKPQSVGKFNQKVAQQIINAKFITQNMDTQKIVQQKVIIGQQNQLKLANKQVQQSKPVTLATTNPNSLRMVNATNLNLAHLGGKPVLLASKGSTLQNIQGQNVIIQTQANTSSALVALSTSKGNSIPAQSVISQGGQVMFAPQLKMQPQVLLSSNVKNSSGLVNQVSSGQIIVGGHPVRLQTSTASPKVVLAASQGQGGQIVAQQILLPAGFQGTAINIKSLQGVKVIPIAQQSKGVQGRPVFARVMNPSSLVRATAVPAPELTNTTPTTE